jgi:surface polysaccharide O-acyltransferase-like enzyme
VQKGDFPASPAGRDFQDPSAAAVASLIEEGETMKTNYAAVFVSALAYWILGAVWYAVLFSKPWMAFEHITEEQARSMNPVLPYIITFVLNILIALVLAQLCIWRNASTAARGAAVGVLVWIGFLGPVTYTTYMYEMRPKELFAINQFYPLVGLCLMGAILGAWKKRSA